MLDRVNIDRSVHFPRTIEVVEKRAPTDESVRLLREMEGAAWSRVLDSLRAGTGNEVQGVVAVSRDYASQTASLWVSFALNGHEHRLRIEHQECVLRPREAIEHLIRLVGERIGELLVSSYATEIVMRVAPLQASAPAPRALQTEIEKET